MFRSLLSLFRTHWLRLISMSMIFALVVMVITIVEQIITNIDTQIESQTKPLVGADIVIEQNTKFDDAAIQTIQKLVKTYPQSQMLHFVEFYTTLGNSSDPKLVKVKGIENGYPLYGDLVIDYFAKSTDLTGVVMDAESHRLIGQSGSVQLGKLFLPVQGIITQQAELGFNFLDEGRTIIIPYQLVASTKLTDIGSRVEYQLQIALQDETQVERLAQQLKQSLGQDYQIRLARDRIQQVSSLIDQLDQYTSIIVIITLVLSLTIMATATMTMTLKIKRSIAIMRILGLTRGAILGLMMMLYGFLFVTGTFIGVGLSFLLFQNISSLSLAQDFIWSRDVLQTIGAIVAISAIVACRQPIAYLVSTHPLTLLQSLDQTKSNRQQVLGYSLLGIGSWILLLILTGKGLFSVWIIIGAIISMVIIYLILRLCFTGLLRSSQRRRSSLFARFDAVRQTIIPGNQTALLVGGLSVSLIGFCVIVSVSLSFLDRLRISSLDQPNIFVLNVRTDDVPKIQQFDPQARLYDTILGRIESINNRSLADHLTLNLESNARAGEFTREFNITSVNLTNSPLIQGVPLTTGGISLDQDFAKNLSVGLGDRIRLLIQGRRFDLQVTSLRKSIRTGSEPFFYIQLDSSQFAQAPRSWFRVSRQADETLPQFKTQALGQIGNHLSFIDVSAVISLVTDIANKIIAIIIACMTTIIVLIICVSIASNEAGALVARQTYRLYHIIGMTKSELMRIALRVASLYTVAILIILLIAATSLLRVIYSNALILTRSWASLIPLSLGVFVTLCVMILSYRGFHRAIIKSV